MRIIKIEQGNIHNTQTFGNKKRAKRERVERERVKLQERAAKKADIERYGNAVRAFYAPFVKSGSFKNDEPAINVSQSFENTHATLKLDKYQKNAINAYLNGNSVIVSAPTGTGKTLIAEYIINDAIKNGKKLIYTSPLKALSNEKYTDFCKLFGTYDENGNLVNTDNIGLMTGDTTINPDAPVVVMTTEVYHNSLMTKSKEEINEKYKDYNAVIYDEFQYLGDFGRGKTWEESLMNTPNHMRQIMLSATASNSSEIAKWLNGLNSNIKTTLVGIPESERHVPLREFALTHNHLGELELTETKKRKINLNKLQNKYQLSERQFDAFETVRKFLQLENDKKVLEFMASIQGEKKTDNQAGEAKENIVDANALSEKLTNLGMEESVAIGSCLALGDEKSTEYEPLSKMQKILPQKVYLNQVVKVLDDRKMTPALLYIFSKKKCDKELAYAAENGKSLLTKEESQEVYNEIQKMKEKDVFLGVDFKDGSKDMVALMKGYAVHHAGRLPAYKSLVEKLARKGLIKACFATETLAAGINMPFRTTVFTEFEKKDDDNEFGETRTITIPNQVFKQGMGRAGRRGKDYFGNVVVMPKESKDYSRYLEFSKSNDTSIISKYNISYASILSDKMLNDIENTLSKTIYVYQNPAGKDTLEEKAKKKLALLEDFKYVVKDEDGNYQRTEKGDIASKVFGINEIFMTELLYNPKYLEGCTASELIAICASFADVKDRNQRKHFRDELEYLDNRMEKIVELANDVNLKELEAGTTVVPPRYSTKVVPYIMRFANAPDDRTSSVDSWNEIMSDLRKSNIIPHEGDFFRLIGRTEDLLRLVAELSPDSNIRDEARKAVDKFKKAPITDIFNYELNMNKNEDN